MIFEKIYKELENNKSEISEFVYETSLDTLNNIRIIFELQNLDGVIFGNTEGMDFVIECVLNSGRFGIVISDDQEDCGWWFVKKRKQTWWNKLLKKGKYESSHGCFNTFNLQEILNIMEK